MGEHGGTPPYPLNRDNKWGNAGMDFVRRAEHEGAFAPWQTDCQLRMQHRQIPHSWHSGTLSAGGAAQAYRDCASICPLTN